MFTRKEFWEAMASDSTKGTWIVTGAFVGVLLIAVLLLNI